MSVKGVGKDEPTVTNPAGGKQSKVHYRFDLLDPKAMFEMTKVLHEGAQKYGEDNWRLIDVADHLNHMLIHAYAYLAGDTSDEHLSHILCRAMFAQAVAVQDSKDLMKVKGQLGLSEPPLPLKCYDCRKMLHGYMAHRISGFGEDVFCKSCYDKRNKPIVSKE